MIRDIKNKVGFYKKRLEELIFGEYVEFPVDPVFEQMKEQYCKEQGISEKEFYKRFYKDLEEMAEYVQEAIRTKNGGCPPASR